MLQYKKRLRLLVEELGGEVEYLHNDALAIQFESGRVEFVPTSRSDMEAIVDLGNGPSAILLPQLFCFDITDCLAHSCLTPQVLDAQTYSVLQLSHYIEEEQGDRDLKELQAELARNPGLDSKDLGGNMFRVSYYRGILILRYILSSARTYVIEFNATTPLCDDV